MSCYHPLIAVPSGVHPSGKTKYTILGSSQVDYDETQRINPEAILIPCGQCIGCRLDYSRQWANRCLLESQLHSDNCFITLTYDNEHIEHLKRSYVNPETGEYGESLSLCKRDWQLFMKLLRKQFPDKKIRFFACGEYGDSTFRPHMHAILFGVKFPDLKPYKLSDLRYQYYTSEILSKCWKRGFAVVGDVSWETCAYTARYICKKLKGPEAKFYSDFDLEPPFSLMSRKPGLAHDYYDPEKVRKNSEYVFPTERKVVHFTAPKYFRQLFDIDFPEESAIIKAGIRSQVQARKELRLKNTDLSYLELLQVDEDDKLRRLHKLHRDLD